jgi:hypothetical protein
MAWEHFDVKKMGKCKILKIESNEIFVADYQMGIIFTGKTRSFWGHQIKIEWNDKSFSGKSQNSADSYLSALSECNKNLESEGLRLLVAGNSPSYSESGLSSGSGFGYVNGRPSAIEIMSEYIE